MRRLENWKHEDLAATGYIYNLYHYIWGNSPTLISNTEAIIHMLKVIFLHSLYHTEAVLRGLVAQVAWPFLGLLGGSLGQSHILYSNIHAKRHFFYTIKC